MTDFCAPTISVIIPVFDTEAYLSQCLESILAQTKTDFEIICVDDKTPDNSVDIIKEYQNQDKRIRLLHHEVNKGLGGARNTGIRAARAPFVTGVDSDDHIEPGLLEDLWQLTDNGTADISAGACRRVTTDNEEVGRIHQPQGVFHDSKPGNIFETLLPAFWAKLWRKSIFVENNIWFPENVVYEDLATTPRLVYYASDIRSTDTCLYNYVERTGSITRSIKTQNVADLFNAYQILADFLRQQNLTQSQICNLWDKIGKSLYNYASSFNDYADEETKNKFLRLMLNLKLGFIDNHNASAFLSEQELLPALRYANSPMSLLGQTQNFSKKKLAGPVREIMRVSPPQTEYLINFSKKHSYIYIETPKVACSTIKKNLQLLEHDGCKDNLVEDVHDRQQSPLLGIKQDENEFEKLLNEPGTTLFCFVRNPFSRALSCYLDKFGEKQRRLDHYHRLLDRPDAVSLSFKDFLLAVREQIENHRNPHWTSQSFILQPKLIRYDFIGRFESFDADLRRLLDRIDVGQNFTPEYHAPHASHAMSLMSRYYSKDEVHLVQEIYEADFTNFGYGWAPPLG